MKKAIKTHGRMLFLLLLILFVGLNLTGCDAGDPADTSETYNALITIEGVIDEDHADLFSISADGEPGIDQFNYEEDILTGNITDLDGSVELTLIVDNDELEKGRYITDNNSIEIDYDNNEAEFIVEFNQEENNEEVVESWTVEVEEDELKEENVEVEIEERMKLTIPSENFNEKFRVTVDQYDVETLPEVDKLHDVQETYSIYIDDMEASSQTQTNALSSPIMLEIYNQDGFNKDEILFMSYIDNQWRILNRKAEFNRNSFSLQTDNLRDLEKLTYSYINIQQGSTRSLDWQETITERGDIKQEIHIEGIEGVIGNLGEAPWYKIDFYGENNVRDISSPGDYIFNYLGFKYIPPGESKDLILEYYGIGGKVDMRLLSSGVEILPIFFADLLYMTLNNGESLPFPIDEDMLLDDDMEVAVEFLDYIEDEIDEINIEFDSLHNNALKLINWGRDKILEYAEDEVTGEIKDRIKNAMGHWWTFIHTANRSVSSVVFAAAGEDVQYIEIGSETYSEIELEPTYIELSPGDSQKLTARAHPRDYKDITLTVPNWNWSSDNIGEFQDDSDGRTKFVVDEEANEGDYSIEVNTYAFRGGETIELGEEATLIVKEKESDVNARIEGVELFPKEPAIDEKMHFNVAIKNTGNISNTFYVGTSIWHEKDPDESFNFDNMITIDPGDIESIKWSYLIEEEGEWGCQFFVWEDMPLDENNLLDKSDVLYFETENH